MKDNPVSCFLNVNLKVPRGLWKLLENLQTMTNETPKEYLERSLALEVTYILNDLPGDMFDLKHMQTVYGEGSDTTGVAI